MWPALSVWRLFDCKLLILLVPGEGFEPPTFGLQNHERKASVTFRQPTLDYVKILKNEGKDRLAPLKLLRYVPSLPACFRYICPGNVRAGWIECGKT